MLMYEYEYYSGFLDEGFIIYNMAELRMTISWLFFFCVLGIFLNFYFFLTFSKKGTGFYENYKNPTVGESGRIEWLQSAILYKCTTVKNQSLWDHSPKRGQSTKIHVNPFNLRVINAS